MTPEISTYERLLEMEARQRQDPFWGRIHRQLDGDRGRRTHHQRRGPSPPGQRQLRLGFFHGGMDRELLGLAHHRRMGGHRVQRRLLLDRAAPRHGREPEYIEGDVYNRTDR